MLDTPRDQQFAGRQVRDVNADSKIDTSIYEGAGGQPERYDVDDNGEPLWYATHVIGLCEEGHTSAIAVEHDDDSVKHAHVPLRYVVVKRSLIFVVVSQCPNSSLAAFFVLLLTAHPLSYFRYSSVRLRTAGTPPGPAT